MGLNTNAKGLKSQRRIDWETLRLEESARNARRSMNIPDPPYRGVLDEAWLSVNGAGNTHELAGVCGNCWQPILKNAPAWGQPDYGWPEGEPEWVHYHSRTDVCWRKRNVTVFPLPGLLIINELDLVA